MHYPEKPQIRIFLLTLYLLAFTGIVIFLSGCEKENKAPNCTITDPENGEEIPHGTQVIISVDDDDADGIVNGVNFYIDTSSIGISNSSPYNYEWNTLDEETGSHSIKAIATDDSGNSLSDKITVLITEGVPVAEFAAYQTSVSSGSRICCIPDFSKFRFICSILQPFNK